MSENGSDKKGKNAVIQLNIDGNLIPFHIIKSENKKIIEFDPNKIRDGEAIIYKNPKFWGLWNDSYVVANFKEKITVEKLH